MQTLDALHAAIDLVQLPSRVRFARDAELPSGLDLLLRIAAGDDGAIRLAIEPTGRTEEFLRVAAEFYIEQILLAPSSDSYRVLGCSTRDGMADLRRNMALLLRWLHPDLSSGKERSIYARRITAAWDDLKTPERRTAYDIRCSATPAAGEAVRNRSLRRPPPPLAVMARSRPRPLSRILALLFGRRH